MRFVNFIDELINSADVMVHKLSAALLQFTWELRM